MAARLRADHILAHDNSSEVRLYLYFFFRLENFLFCLPARRSPPCILLLKGIQGSVGIAELAFTPSAQMQFSVAKLVVSRLPEGRDPHATASLWLHHYLDVLTINFSCNQIPLVTDVFTLLPYPIAWKPR